LAQVTEDATGDDVPIETKPPRLVSVAIVGIFLILLTGALFYARDFVLPVILALLVTLTFMPAVRYLSRRGLPPALSAVLLVIAIGAVTAGGAVVLADPVSEMIEKAPEFAASLQQRIGGLEGPLGRLVDASEQLRGLAESAGGGEQAQKVVIAEPGIVAILAETLSGIGATLAATLILAVFLLSSGDLFLQKIVRALPTLHDKKRSLRIVRDVEAEVSRYLVTITAINIGFGIAVGLAMWVIGMPNPLLWGIAAALLNYIPYVGTLAGVVLTGAVGLVVFPTLGGALIAPAAYIVINLIENTAVTPVVLGRRLELNAVAILVALAFAGWMWGIVGAVIAVPLLVVVKVFCDHFEGLATFGDFLSEESPKIDTADDPANGGGSQRDTRTGAGGAG
jgi:predicted PurR-regulated permease PerM